jgi:hypothetical protein
VSPLIATALEASAEVLCFELSECWLELFLNAKDVFKFLPVPVRVVGNRERSQVALGLGSMDAVKMSAMLVLSRNACTDNE